MNPRVKKIKTLPDYKLLLEFSNNESGVFDCSYLLNLGVFQELKDVDYFNRAYLLDGTVAWPHEQDICPDTLYENSKNE